MKTCDLKRITADILILASRALALTVIAVYAPILLVAAALLLITSQGPAFVRRAYRRHGGEVVLLYEFRTECWSDYRETPLGAFLRRADFVRLPRLANVLMGHVCAGERVVRLHD